MNGQTDYIRCLIMKNRLVNLRFPKGYIELYLENNMIVKVPVGLFPDIKKLPAKDRDDWQILDGVGFTFKKSDEGFHLRQFGLR